jgi:DNA invertase Pin-like site-specific DNA recombinase
MTVRAYLRCSTQDQMDSALGLEAQRHTIEQEAQRRGWTEIAWYVDGGRSGKDLNREEVIRLLAEVRHDDYVVVSRLDRLSRSLVDFAGLMETAKKQRWVLIALDLGVDMTTPTGRMVAGIMANLAEWERSLISARTTEAMAAAKRRGVRMGHRSRIPMQIQDEVERLWLTGLSMCEVARRMTAQGVPTVENCPRWHASTVSTVLSSLANDRLAGLIA